jgi:hypothetical protein
MNANAFLDIVELPCKTMEQLVQMSTDAPWTPMMGVAVTSMPLVLAAVE